MNDLIKINGANANNLKNISVCIPINSICGICGVSGSGKSTLARDIIAKYAINSFALSVPVKLRKKIFDIKTPEVDNIENLPPVIFIDVKNANKSIRSTVATVSGIMTILRNMFSQCSTNNVLKKNTLVYPRLFSYNISENDGGGSCSCCGGTGRVNAISPESIIIDASKAVLLGALLVVNEKGIKYTKISDLFIKAFCKEYGIDINKPLEKYSNSEMDLLLFGTEKIIRFTDRNGGNNGKKEMPFPGIIGALLDSYNRTNNVNIEKIITDGICNVCKGSRYNKLALEYKLGDYNIADFLGMNINCLREVVSHLVTIYKDRIEGLTEELLTLLQELEMIGVSYLELDRPIKTLSGGELQRIKLARQISMKYEGNCYVIDEPSTGLHDSNIVELMKSIERLKVNGNTVVLIEHNPLVLAACDYLVELGPGGGCFGGSITATGTPREILQKETLTGKMLQKHLCHLNSLESTETKMLKVYGVTVNNLKNIDIEIPLKSFVTVAGVSGSGKSSAINNALFNIVNEFLDTGNKKNNIVIEENIEGIIKLDQSASVTNSRSNVGTLLGILDKIRMIFTRLNQSQEMGFDISSFSKNSKMGSCCLCGGTGAIVDEDKIEYTCDSCNGTGYRPEILKVKYKGYSISEILDLTIDELFNIFDDDYINNILLTCQKVGLGYLSLSRKSPTLSKGEYQRIRLVVEICKPKTNNCIYILDEPSKGLHYSDVEKIIIILRNLVSDGNTVIAIEHNIDVITNSDYVLEFGPESGAKGGKIVYSGPVKGLYEKDTHTAQAIKGFEISMDNCKNKIIKDTIHVQAFEHEFYIDKSKINVLKGSIGSGKTTILKKLIYANPLKRYIASISTQGKYYTRDIIAEKNEGDVLPITRLICDDISSFDRNERVLETINLTGIVEKLFYEYGFHEQDICRSSFNFSKKAGKCVACSGSGRFMSYDFNLIFSDKECSKDLYKLLHERTRISRIAPLIKEDYKIDILKQYSDMSEDEESLFLFGDKNKTVYYAPKKKDYYWDGCNTILFSN